MAKGLEVNILYIFCFEHYIPLTHSVSFITQAADICYKQDFVIGFGHIRPHQKLDENALVLWAG